MTTGISQDDVERIAIASAKAACAEIFLTMGIDASDPKSLIELQKDFAHLRSWRDSIEAVRSKGLLTAVGVIVTGICALIWMALHK